MWYYIYRESDGVLISETSQAPDSVPDGLVALERANRQAVGEVWDQATRDFVDAPAPVEITRVEFLRRFTVQERIGARTLAKTDPVIEDFLALLDLAESVRLDDPDVTMALGYLTQQNVLASGRAGEILGG